MVKSARCVLLIFAFPLGAKAVSPFLGTMVETSSPAPVMQINPPVKRVIVSVRYLPGGIYRHSFNEVAAAAALLNAVVLSVPVLPFQSPIAPYATTFTTGPVEPRFAKAAAVVVAPVPPFASAIGPERARVTFPVEPPPIRPWPAITPVRVLAASVVLGLLLTPGNV
jgi:hypothetical protein